MIIGGGNNLFSRAAGKPKPADAVMAKPLVIGSPPPAPEPDPFTPQPKNWAYTYLGVGGTDTQIDLQPDPGRDTRHECAKPTTINIDPKRREYHTVTHKAYVAALPIPDVVAQFHGGIRARVFVTTKLPEVYVIEVFCGEEYIGYCNLFAPRNWGIHTKWPGEKLFGDKTCKRIGKKTSGWVIKGGFDPLDATAAIVSLIKHWDSN